MRSIIAFLISAIVVIGLCFYSIASADDVPIDPAPETAEASSSESEESEETSSPTTEPESTESSATTTDDTTITTGDATASTTISNDVNGSNTETGGNDADIDNTSTTTIDNTSTTTAATGENMASTTGNAIITTGTSYATANVINIANTNILNSQGFLYFLSQIFGIQSFDLRSIFGSFANADPSSCSLLSCGDGDVTFVNSSDASITNDVVVRSGSGTNLASSTGDGLIQTGDAYAAANVLNIVNTNIADSNYLMVVFNNFGDFGGDIVLPGASLFQQLFNNSSAGGLESLDSTTNNDATIANNTDTEAETGNNSASTTDGAATVNTGDAISSTNVVNHVNQNIIGNDSFVILFRVFGKWNGSVLGTPQNVLWEQSAGGIKLYTAPSFDASEGSLGAQATSDTDATLNASSTGNANIENNVSVYALTGDNKVASTEGDATVNTGNAYASTNIVNVANTNVIGRNWVLLIFNIFGDWFGNLSFGRPDLWVGGAATSDSNPIRNGSRVTYKFTVANKGDSDATNVVLKADYDRALLAFENPGTTPEASATGSEGTSQWSLGTIKAGETREVSYDANVASSIPGGETPISLSASVSATGNDENAEDNEDVIAITAVNPTLASYSGGGGGGSWNSPSALKITKSANVATTTASSTVSYMIKIKNNGGPAFNSVLADVIKDAEGRIIKKKQWSLQTIKSDETVEVTYDVVFSASSTPGVYHNAAQVFAFDQSADPLIGHKITSELASTSVEVVGSVLGASTTACTSPYLTGFLGYGKRNDPGQVTKLQEFLKNSEHFDNVLVSGYFDIATREAVKAFQLRYSADILGPWALPQPTGYVYLTTRKKINELSCGGTTSFPLTEAEMQKVIFGSRASKQIAKTVHIDLPKKVNN